MKDKNYEEVMRILSSASKEFVTVAIDYSRALSSDELADLIGGLGLNATMCSSVKEGVDTAMDIARRENGVVCCVGSLYLAGEVREIFSPDATFKRLV
jgi:folylpolyglutamate synthase/dihydropteroate synthase